MPVLCVGSTKGGVGKSTISVNIAASAAKQGSSVLLIDTDKKQLSSLAWRSLRKRDDITAVSMPEPTLHRELDPSRSLRNNYELIIIDSGGRDDKMFRSAIMACDILLIPVLPSAFDVYAAEDTINILRESNASRMTDVEAYLLLNQFKENAKVGRRTQEALEKYSDSAQVLTTKLHDYTAYKNCLDSGVGVVELPGAGKAAGEVDYLVHLLGLLYKKED